ncbi:MAG: alcohol dehydrogenase catalytic domain-containing protein [Dehalococcoidia bacterium]
MKAAALKGSRSIEIIDLPDDPPGPGEVRLRVAFCGICGSDMHEYESATPFRALGAMQPVMGHEFTGRIVALGEGVSGLSVGQAGVGNPGSGCGSCYYCQAGREQLCRSGTGIGYTKAGAYAEYVTLPARGVVPLPEGAPLRDCALTEPLAVARHALIEGGYRPGELLVVAGAGPIGLLTVIAARSMGSERIVVSEPLEGRQQAAVQAGATHVVPPSELLSLTQSLSDGLGAPISVDTSGIPAGVADCQNATMRGGRIVIAGVGEQPYSLDILRIIISEHRFIGVLGYTRAQFAESAMMIAEARVDVSPVISEVVPVEATGNAFERLSGGRDGLRKILVSPDA